MHFAAFLPCPGMCKGRRTFDRKRRRGWRGPGWAAARSAPLTRCPGWSPRHCWAPGTMPPGWHRRGLGEATTPSLRKGRPRWDLLVGSQVCARGSGAPVMLVWWYPSSQACIPIRSCSLTRKMMSLAQYTWPINSASHSLHCCANPSEGNIGDKRGSNLPARKSVRLMGNGTL